MSRHVPLEAAWCPRCVFLAVLLLALAFTPSAAAASGSWGSAGPPPVPALDAAATESPAAESAVAPSLLRVVAEDGVADPVGDTIGVGVHHIDLRLFQVVFDDEQEILFLYFETEDLFSAPDSAAPDALVGYIDIDTDQDGTTGVLSHVDTQGGGSSGLGVEYFVNLFTYSSATGDADLVDAVANAVVGRVTVALDDRVFFVFMPYAMLHDEGEVDAAAVIGTVAEPTDIVPNTGSVASSPNGVMLNHHRFAVHISWRGQFDNEGYGRLAVRSEDSANFWFFRESNWEVLLKVLNGCPVNGHYWVFFAATTNVEFTIEVSDQGNPGLPPAVYTNAQGHAANAVTDTRAFDTCP